MKTLTPLFDRLRSHARDEMPALATARVVIAASGGADSAAAVALLCEAGITDRSRAVVAHFDHRLRPPAEGGRDRACVDALAARYALPVVYGAWDAPASSEARARDARYRFLARVAHDHSAEAVVTGHTADDQAETIVMNMSRGAGLRGVAGMRADAPWPLGDATLHVLRPLLALSRAETRAVCADLRLPYADDPSNDSRAFLRNRVRLDVLPAMERTAPGTRDALLRLSSDARSALGALDELATGAWHEDRDGIVLSRTVLRAMPPAVRTHACCLALEHLLGDARDFGRRHYADLSASVDAATGSTFHLPRGVVATVDAEGVLLTVGAPGVEPIDAALAVPLPFAGEVGAWRVSVAAAREALAAVRFPPDAVLRGRRPGDRVQPRGMLGHRKLQDLLVDRKVPRRERDAAPVIACGSDVLWTPFASLAAIDAGVWFIVDAERIRGA